MVNDFPASAMSVHATEQHPLEAFLTDRSDAAFEQLVAEHLGLVYGCALRRTRNPELAEDIAQQVFTILARKAPRLNAGGGLDLPATGSVRFLK